MDHLIIFGAQYLIFIVAILAVAHWFISIDRKDKIRLVATVVIGLIVATIIAKVASKLYYDPRPFVKSGVKPLFPHAPDNGFPSDHTYLAATTAVAYFFYRRNFGVALFVLAVLVGICRVAAHVHSPIDIAGGLVVGAVGATVGYYAVSRYWPNQPQKRPEHDKTMSSKNQTKDTD
ncbi:MAG TPA: undecaprenyl-diphosphatase [Candidatus Saccharimonadales bacterium]|nr:undecaprenyl-diphosphatase [Candidatus Saccharimonadales bacterium]